MATSSAARRRITATPFAPSWYTAPKPGGAAQPQQKPSATISGLKAAPAAPPNPFPTPDDLASQALENAEWDRYFSGMEFAAQQLERDTNDTLAQNEVTHGRNLEATDWNMAARGLNRSSIKDVDKANQIKDFTAQKESALRRVTDTKNNVQSERHKYATTIKPLLDAKWAAKHAENARAAAALQAENQAGAAAGAPAPAAAAKSYKPVVKNGKFYHLYGAGTIGERWVYIRPASG